MSKTTSEMRWYQRLAWGALLVGLTVVTLPFIAYDDARAALRGER